MPLSSSMSTARAPRERELNATDPVTLERKKLLDRFDTVITNWTENAEKLDNQALEKVCWLLEWNDQYLHSGTDSPRLNTVQLDYLYNNVSFIDILDKGITHYGPKGDRPANAPNPFYTKWGYDKNLTSPSQEKKYVEMEGLEFASLNDVLTNISSQKKVFQQNGAFIATDMPELSILISEFTTRMIEWGRKDKNLYINKAVEARQKKIKEFYESLRETVQEIEASTDKKLTSYKLAAELNKRSIPTYQNAQWMPNMADKLRSYLSEEQIPY